MSRQTLGARRAAAVVQVLTSLAAWIAPIGCVADRSATQPAVAPPVAVAALAEASKPAAPLPTSEPPKPAAPPAAAPAAGEAPPAEAAKPQPPDKTEQARLRRERMKEQFPTEAPEWRIPPLDAGRPAWGTEKWGNPLTLTPVEKDGRGFLQATIAAGDKEKAPLRVGMERDLASRGTVAVEIENTGTTAVGAALAVVTDEWYESAVCPLPVGVRQTLTFDLKAADFKAESTAWKHTASLRQPDQAKWVFLLIYTNQAATVTVGETRIVKTAR